MTITPYTQQLIDLDLDPQCEFNRLFRPGRTPRSEAYRRGVYAGLQCFLQTAVAEPMPYAIGSAESDAYIAGWDEARHEAGCLRAQLVHAA